MSRREVQELSLEEKGDLRDWECWAKDAIHLKLVRCEADITNDETTFHPTYTRIAYCYIFYVSVFHIVCVMQINCSTEKRFMAIVD